MGVWAFLDFALLVAGAITITFSVLWRKPDLLMNMVFSPNDLTVGLGLGAVLIATFLISIGAIVQPNHVTVGIVILNCALVVDAIGVLVVGSFLWFFSLKERANFRVIYAAMSTTQQIAVQDKLSCCGYFNQTDLVQIGGKFCANQTFVDTLAPANMSAHWCVTPVTAFADYALNNTFTTIYGFMAIVLGLFLCSLCVIKVREEDERFKKIDAKRGGRGFV